ncbi:MAG TPA: sensor domain-containing diguanylate cyclase [Thermoleophilia bacterium]|nr:sensor domain-containing diguanylate cyclase [Thermoleophilia bacterium]
MNSVRINRAVAAVALLYGVLALLLPQSAIEILGVPLVVAGACLGGFRGGLLTALWTILVTTVSFFVLHDVQTDHYAVSVAAYASVGIGLGWAVERVVTQRRHLQDAVVELQAMQRQLWASQKRYRLLFEASNDAVYLHGLDAHGEPSRFVAVNDATCRLLGYTREELLGLTPRAVDAPATPGQLRRVMERLLHEDSIVYESARKMRDGHQVPVEISSSLTDVDGEPMVLSISRDIAVRKKTEHRLEQLSLHDELTGLKNRRGFYVLLPEQAKRAKRSGARVVVLYADIDGFKAINDRLGHKRGDDVLRAVAEALQAAFRETDLIARLGGDEFCVVAESPSDPSILVQRLDEAIKTAGEELGLPVMLSYGTVIADWRSLGDPDELLTRADMLMYESKRVRKADRRVEPPGQMASGA